MRGLGLAVRKKLLYDTRSIEVGKLFLPYVEVEI
jgi:hypothetical protein